MKVMRFFPLVVTLLTFSCDSGNEIDASSTTVNLGFTHTVDGTPVQLDQLIYENTLGQQFSIKTIKYFVSGVKLHKANNTEISFPDIHYVDIRTPETLSFTFTDKIPEGDYSGISFVLGLTPAENITGRFTQPPESLMEWPVPMGGGYHYMKLEGEYLTPNENAYFNFHSGMLDGEAYEVHVTMNQPFTVHGNNLNLTFNMEIQNWFRNPVNWDFEYFGPAVMGNHEAQQTIQKNGVDVFSFTATNSNQ